MLSTPMVIWGFVLPAVLAALLIVRRFWDDRGVLTPILICAGFAIAYWHLVDVPRYPPGSNVVDWVVYFCIPLAVLGVLDAVFRPPLWLRAVFLLLLWRVAVRLMLAVLVPRTLSATQIEILIDLSGVVALMWWLSLEVLAERAPGMAVPLVLAILAGGSAVLLGTFPIVRSAELAGALAVVAGVISMVVLLAKNLSLARGGVLVFTSLLLVLLVHGYFYSVASDHPTVHSVALICLVLIAPLFAWAGDLPGIRRMRPWSRLAARVIPVAIIIAIAAGISIKDYLVEEKTHSSMQQEDE